ncbi:MAG: Gfo/Idh/MocA family oxidoreductase [Actinobacteria bacterium]|nr:Gfo/Idh/MocA family oxidoreductase [Actinomycetota bacterium]
MSVAKSRLIRVGIAGLGRSGWDIHAKAMRAMPEKFKIVAVTDPDPARCREASAEFGCRIHPDFTALVNDAEVELTVVATPNRMHPPNTIQAMEMGKNVVCEKPMAATVAEAEEMIKVSRETGQLLAVFQNYRYLPSFLKVREVIESGKLGRIVMIKISIHGFGRRWDWQTLKEFGGGTLSNNVPHFLDQALQLLGEAEPEVFCQLQRTLTSGDAEDHCKVILRASGAPMIDLEITSACAYAQDMWLVMGTQGGLHGSAAKLEWKYVDFSKMPPRPVDRKPTPDRSYNREQYDWVEESWEIPQDFPNEAERFYLDLYETIRQAKPLFITAESVRRQIAILEKCRELSPM